MKKQIIQYAALLLMSLASAITTEARRAKPAAAATASQQIIFDYSTQLFSPAPPRFIKEGTIVTLQYRKINPFACSSAAHFQSIDYSYTDGADKLGKLSTLTGGSAAAAADPAGGGAAAAPMAHAPHAHIAAKKSEQQELIEVRDGLLADINTKLGLLQSGVNIIADILSLDTLTKLLRQDMSIMDNAGMKARLEANMDDAMKTEFQGNTIKGYFTRTAVGIKATLADTRVTIDKLSAVDKKLAAKYPDEAITDRIKLMKSEVEEIYDAYSGNNYNKLLTNVTIIVNNIAVITGSVYTISGSTTATASKDILLFEDKLKDASGKEIFAIAPVKFYTYGGWRVNTSIGVATTVGEINGYEYHIKKNPSGSTDAADTGRYILDESSKNLKAAFNPVVFIHAYRTSQSFVYWRNVTFGFGPDFSDLNKSKLYLGTGIAFSSSADNLPGAVSRLGIDFGIAAGYADVLKEKYAGYSNYAQFSNLDSKDLVDRTIKVGFFVALSFNLSPVKTEQAAKATN